MGSRTLPENGGVRTSASRGQKIHLKWWRSRLCFKRAHTPPENGGVRAGASSEHEKSPKMVAFAPLLRASTNSPQKWWCSRLWFESARTQPENGGVRAGASSEHELPSPHVPLWLCENGCFRPFVGQFLVPRNARDRSVERP